MAEIKINFPVFMGIDQSAQDVPLSLSPDAQNVDTRRGTLRRCLGYDYYLTSGVPGNITCLMKLNKRNGSAFEEILIAATHNAIFYYDKNDAALPWKTIISNHNSGQYSYMNYQLGEDDIVIMSNGTDFSVKWDGSNPANEIPEIPKFTCVTLHFERMWGSGVNNEPDRVYYSAAFDPQDFSTPEQAGFIDIPTFDGGSIVAIQTIFNDVVVFKSENVFRVFGTYPGTYQVDKLYGIVGPVAPNSIVSTGTRVFFLSKQGLCVYDGNQVVPFASLKIKNILNRINPAYVKNACAKYYKDVYYLALPLDDSSVNNAVIEYDTIKNTFMLRYGLRADCFLEFDDRLLISNGSKFVFEYNKGDTYGGEPISAFWETPFLDFGAAGRKKELILFETHAEGEALKIAAYTDSKYREKTISLRKNINYKRARLSGKGRRIKFRFENTQGSDFEMLPPEITVNVEK